MNANKIFEKICGEMIEKYLENNPEFATFVGLHKPYDHLLPKGSTETLEKNLELEREWIERLCQTVKFNELSDEHRIDWELVQKFHRDSKFYFNELRMHELNPDALNLLGSLIFVMFTRNYAPLEKRVDAIGARLEKTPKYLEEFRSRFKNSHPIRLWTETALETAQGVIGLLQFVLTATKDKVTVKTYNRLAAAVENLQPTFKMHIAWLQSLLPTAEEE